MVFRALRLSYRLTEKDGFCEARMRRCFPVAQVLSQAPVLAYLTSEDMFVLDTDASNSSIGTVLSQTSEGEEKVIAYFSRSLINTA